MKRIHEIEQRKLELRTMLENDNVELNLEEIQAELQALATEKTQLEERKKTAEQINVGQIEVRTIEKPQEREEQHMDHTNILSTAEYRSGFFKRLLGHELSDIEKRALTTATGSVGAAVPTQTLNQIIDKLRQTSALFNYIGVTFIPGNLSLVVANAKNAASWKTEGADGTPANDTVTSVTLGGYEIIKLTEISEAALTMTIDQLEGYLTDEIGRQLSIAFENAIVNGDGTGEPTGILNGIAWSADNEVTYTTRVEYDDLMDALGLLPTMYHQNSVFVMNRKTLFGGIRKAKTQDGLPLFNPNPSERASMTILGYPVVLNDYVPDDTIILGEFSFYKWNFSKAPTIETSREAGFRSGKTVFRGIAVADGKPALAEAFVKITKA